MKINESKSHDIIIKNYFETTSAFNSSQNEQTFSVSQIGLARRLGKWLDVSGKIVLDLGSGTGELCALAVDRGAKHVTGVNLSEGEVAFARSRVSAEFVISDICAYLETLADNSVDRIFALNIFEHLEKDKLVIVLEHSKRVLRTDGTLVAMVPNATSPFGGMTRYWDFTHLNAFTPSSIRQIARLTGFSDKLELRECGPVPHGLVSGIRYLLWQCIRIVIRAYLMVELASSKEGIYSADMLFRLRKGRQLGTSKNPEHVSA